MDRLTRLEMLHLARNKLDGDLPAELAWMESMKHLDLGANDLRGELFELDRMTNLRCVTSSIFTVPSSASVRWWLARSTLSLQHNRLTGTIPGTRRNTRDAPSTRTLNASSTVAYHPVLSAGLFAISNIKNRVAAMASCSQH